MKRLTFAGLFFAVWAVAPHSLAQNVNTTQQNSQTTVALYRGQGVTLNFRPTGETVQRAWLDDPSQTTVDFDDANCSVTEATEFCAASVIHLRRINPLNFPGLPSSEVTSLTVLTNNNLYSFRLTFPDTGNPSYSVLNIEPESEIQPDIPAVASQTPRPLTRAEGIAAVEQGLNVAQSRDLISTDDPLWQRAQTFLSLMREGMAAEAAASQAGVSQSLIIRLTELSQVSPTLAI